MEAIETRVAETKKLEETLSLVLEQHQMMVKNLHTVSALQQDIAKQIVQQHEDVQALYLALGLKKDLSYYSFNMMDGEEH